MKQTGAIHVYSFSYYDNDLHGIQYTTLAIPYTQVDVYTVNRLKKYIKQNHNTDIVNWISSGMYINLE